MCPEEFWKSRVAGLSDAQSQPCSCGNADSLSSLSSCGNADSLSPLCAHLGVLHPERQDYRQEGSGCPGRGVLPHYRDAQQRRKGEGGPPSSERIVNEELHISEPQAHGKDQKNDAEISVIFLMFQGTWRVCGMKWLILGLKRTVDRKKIYYYKCVENNKLYIFNVYM